MQLLACEAEVQQITVVNTSRDERQNVIGKVMQRRGRRTRGRARSSHRGEPTRLGEARRMRKKQEQD